MTGLTARLGFIVPSTNATMEPEFNRMAPDGVSVHSTRMEFSSASRSNHENMVEDVPKAVRMLSHARVNAVAFGCTTGSLYGGYGYDETIIARMREHTEVPCTTASTAVVAALREVRADRIAVVTPYQDWLNDLVREFLKQAGFNVLHIRVVDVEGLPVSYCPSERVKLTALEADHPHADTVFLSCTGMKTMDIVASLEQELGKQVVSSNQATMWMLLRLAGINSPYADGRFGTLLAR